MTSSSGANLRANMICLIHLDSLDMTGYDSDKIEVNLIQRVTVYHDKVKYTTI